jgi:GAF domain-containing protein
MRTASEILSAALVTDEVPDALLQRLCQDCAETLPITGVGLALMNDSGHQGVVAATDGPARVMEELQFALGEGPCLDASRARSPVLQPDLARTAVARWPGFGPAALEAGIAAIFAFPLHVGAIRIGILDLYRDTPGSLNPAVLAEALAYADAAVLVLMHLQGQIPPEDGLHPALSDPIENRAEVHQATGVISVSASVSLAEALLLLRARAYAAQRPILEVAREVLAGTLRIHPPRNDHE